MLWALKTGDSLGTLGACSGSCVFIDDVFDPATAIHGVDAWANIHRPSSWHGQHCHFAGECQGAAARDNGAEEQTPSTMPTPPLMEAPPIITAAIALKFDSRAGVGRIHEAPAARVEGAGETGEPEITNTRSVTSVTLMPRSGQQRTQCEDLTINARVHGKDVG